jgi:hypothetical protein
MVATVIAINLSLALACLGLALTLRRVQAALQELSATLAFAEKVTQRTLKQSPQSILVGQDSIKRFRQQIIAIKAMQWQISRWASLLGLFRLFGIGRNEMILALGKSYKCEVKR